MRPQLPNTSREISTTRGVYPTPPPTTLPHQSSHMIPHDTYLCHPVAAPFRVGMDCTFCRTSRHACLPVSTTVGALCHHARTAGVMRAPPATVSPRVGLHRADRLHQVLRLGTDMPPPKGGDALHPHRQPLMPGSVAADPRHASGTCSRSTVSGATHSRRP